MKLPAAYLQAEEGPLRTEMLQPEPTGCRRQGSAGPVQKGAHQKEPALTIPKPRESILQGRANSHYGVGGLVTKLCPTPFRPQGL